MTVTLLDSENFLIQSESTNGGNNSSVELMLLDSSRNGLFSYSYTIDASDKESLFVEQKIPNAIYHMVKEFYHKHEYHEQDEDSLLTAFTSQEPISIKDPDSQPLSACSKYPKLT